MSSSSLSTSSHGKFESHKRELVGPSPNQDIKHQEKKGRCQKISPATKKQIEDSPRLATLTSKCQTLDWIRFNLCDLKATAGAILRHAIAVIQSLFLAEEPLIFKIGFTHNPIWRWTNDVYGYCKARERWHAMIVLHYSREPYTAAMLEAALIEKFHGNSVLIGNCSFFLLFLGRRILL